MNSDKCDITLVLDESGSMGPLQLDTIGGVNRFLADQRKLPGSCHVSVVKFNDTSKPVYLARDIKDAPDLTTESYAPEGSTALLDAVGFAIDEAGSRFKAMKEEDRPGKVIFVIVTDGEENASRTRKKADIKDAVERQKNIYKWEFVFLGANIDAFAEGYSLGISSLNTIQTHSTPQSVNKAYTSLSANAASFRAGGQSMGWSKEQYDEQEQSK